MTEAEIIAECEADLNIQFGDVLFSERQIRSWLVQKIVSLSALNSASADEMTTEVRDCVEELVSCAGVEYLTEKEWAEARRCAKRIVEISEFQVLRISELAKVTQSQECTCSACVLERDRGW